MEVPAILGRLVVPDLLIQHSVNPLGTSCSLTEHLQSPANWSNTFSVILGAGTVQVFVAARDPLQGSCSIRSPDFGTAMWN